MEAGEERRAARPGGALGAHLGALAALVPLAAAADALRVRLDHPHHGTEATLYLHALLLWGAFGLLALAPALLLSRLVERRGPAPAGLGRACRTAFALAGPVVAHQVLDAHTAIGQDVRALLAARPWLELLGAELALGLLLALSAYAGRRLGPRGRLRLGASVAVVSVAAGLLLPPEPGPAPPRGRAPAGAPNVLFLVWDTTRADRTQPYGYGRPTTPALERFAERALVFEEARSVSIFTFTSHVSMLTGRYPAATGARLHRMRLDPRYATSVAERFAEGGWRTGAFVGTWVLSGTTGVQRGFEVYDDRVDPDVALTAAWKLVHDVQAVLADKLGVWKQNGQPHWFQDFQRPAAEVLDRALAWIGNGDPRPWFCMVNLYDVHWPYVPSADARARFVAPYDGPLGGYLFRGDGYPAGRVPTPEDGRHVGELYDAEMSELDARVERFLDALHLDRGDTAVLVTADHGEAFGEGGRFEHDDILEPQVRVPLLVRPAGKAPPSGRRAGRASGVDVAPTLLALAGLEVPGDLHGVDLLGGELPPDREILVEDRDHEGVDDVRLALYSGRFKLVRLGVGERAVVRLHDLERDPVGLVDVAAEHPEVARRMAQRLDELRAPWADADRALVLDGPGANADALGGLGYLGDDSESR